MSKTHKTAPWPVQVARAGQIRVEHDHRDGTCNMPHTPTLADMRSGFQKDRCHAEPTDSMWFARGGFCGCHLCTNHDGRRADRRRSRHESKAELRRQMKDGGRS